MSHCKKFTPNIFNKIKCSNCFRQKEEHSAEALECNRASRSIARSGYLFVAPDWDFSVPLNRTKRWQRRWFVLYDDGELNYSVDEHPDTVPQGSVDMSQVLEVTGAEQITGHPHSLALTGPDRVTFVKAASREDARWWVELLAVFPRRHKRNATFPGGRASPSLPQLGRSASPQPPRPRHLSCTGPSPRTNFTTPPLKEERESPGKEDVVRPNWPHDVPTVPMTIEPVVASPRNDYVVSSGSPPTRDKLRCEDKARVRRDWRNERLRVIATALTDRSPESSLALPAEGLLHLKKGWLWFKDHNNGDWQRLWWVLCGPALSAYKDQDEQTVPEVSVELSSVTSYSEIQTETRYGFQIQWSGPTLTLSAVTAGIRSNWLQALKKAAPNTESPSMPATPRSALLSSDEEYRTASEGGRRDSEDWSEYNPSSPIEKKTLLGRVRDRNRLRPKLPRCQSRQSTVDSVSTDELDGFKDPEDIMKQSVEVDELKRQLANAINDVQSLENEISRLKNLHADSMMHEQQSKELVYSLEKTEKELSQKIKLADEKFNREQKLWQRRISEYERDAREAEDRCATLSRELQTKQRIVSSLQEELKCANERLSRNRLDNDRLYKKLQEIEGKNLNKSKCMASLTDLTDIDLDIDLDTLNQNELIEQCLDLRSRFEKAVIEIRAVKKELRDSHVKFDELELENVSLKSSLDMAEQQSQAQATLMASRVQDLTNKLATVEKQARSLKSKLQDSREKRRSLSLKGRENFSINKEVEDKVTELEAKILSLERGRSRRKHRRDRSNEAASPIDDKSLRRIRRKSLDSATSSEPMKLLMRLSTLESKVNQVNTSNESLTTLNASLNDLNNLKTEDTNNLSADSILRLAKEKLTECQQTISQLRNKKSSPSSNIDRLATLESALTDLSEILSMKFSESEINVVNTSAKSVVVQLENLLREKLKSLEEKKNALRECGELTQAAKMEIFAEKIAFENLIIGRIEEAVKLQITSDNSCERLLCKETIETANLVAKLQSKLTDNSKHQLPNCITSISNLTKVLTKRLLYFAHGLSYPSTLPTKNINPAIKYLEEEQNKVNSLLTIYKTNKLPKLAEALALESLTLSSDESCRLNVDEGAIKDTWSAAREIINSELIISEINHVLMRTAQKYEALSSSDQSYFFTFFAYERAMLELWSDAVENTLRAEMERYIEELNEVYQSSLIKLQRQNWRRKLEEKGKASSSVLLNEYADVIAHKALIDSRIYVLKGETESSSDNGDNSFIMNLFDLESLWNCMENLNLVDVRLDLQAEFKSMLDKSMCEISSDLFCKEDLDEMCKAVQNLNGDIISLGNIINTSIESNCDDYRSFNFKDIIYKCKDMQKAIKEIEQNVLILKNNSNKRYDNSDEDRRPLYLGTEYLNQVENLRAAYRKTLSECESHKQQGDLEQLQILCERVLVAMEHWHRRTLQDLRESHTKELLALRQDKEQALAEETQATLAALDAMRKAHEAEVQKEVARFKQNFAREQQNELLELNDRLSVKCLETAALQEQLGSANRQLANAQQHILQLERSPKISLQN